MRRYAIILITLLLALPARAGQALVLGGSEHEVTRVSLAVMEVAYAKIGVDVEFKLYPASKRSLVEANDGNIDAEVNRVEAVGETYTNLIRIPVPINSIDSMVFSCDEAIKVDGWDSIRELRIGIMQGIRYAEDATQGMPHVTTMPDYDHLFDLLALDRLDIVIASRPTGYWQNKRIKVKCIRVNEPPLTSLLLYHYLNRRHADLVPRLTKVLQDMANSGEMATIREKATQEYRNSKR